LPALKKPKENPLFPRLNCEEPCYGILLVLHASGVSYVGLFAEGAGWFCDLQLKGVHSFLNLASLGNRRMGR